MSDFTVTVEGYEPFKAEAGKKLVLAIEDGGVDISHRCGGNARCTTCRVEFVSAEPEMGEVEKNCLEEDGVLGQFRLSCQIRLDRDMNVKVMMPVSTAGWDNPGGDVEP